MLTIKTEQTTYQYDGIISDYNDFILVLTKVRKGAKGWVYFSDDKEVWEVICTCTAKSEDEDFDCAEEVLTNKGYYDFDVTAEFVTNSFCRCAGVKLTKLILEQVPPEQVDFTY